MRCAWDALMRILPPALRPDADAHARETLQELRLRLGQAPELVCDRGSKWGNGTVTEQELNFVVNTASRYSPWAAATASKGYITAPGGHRIGLCGEAVVRDGTVCGIRSVTSLCIRVARDFTGIAGKAAALPGNILILGPPGSGKTTLLRDLIRQLSERETVTVVDERGELFPADFIRGRKTDVLTLCSKAQGVEMALRTMGPTCIAVDEITAQEDCRALLEAGWCGVRLLATAHAASRADLAARPVYRPLWETKLFETVIILRSDKSWRTERMTI
ncbi:MAG: Flp pilus assembly complex ATPase component TadA [Oscillospiraceae bacterium]|nr:Flp pilus assembly complex ATPase component TadA [Oscillospiraceae bacterium]